MKLAALLTLAACSVAGTGGTQREGRGSDLTLRHAVRTQAIGVVTEYPLPGSRSSAREPMAITLGPDGALWFAEHNDGIGRITTAGSLTEYRVPGNAGPYDIAAGPDGALWFTDLGAKLWRVTTDGQFTAYPVPGNALPTGITAGPDGAMWFIAPFGRITMTGQITEFPTAVGFNSIVTGPDGALWSPWSDSRHPAGISRTTTAGVSTLYQIPGKNLQVVAVGPDHKIWFTQHHACRPSSVGKISTEGSYRRYQVVGCAVPTGIAAGPDGAMWFTELRDDHIDRITLDGRITRYPIPTSHAGPYGITAGPDGAVWFTEGLAGKIGRIQAI
jgi:virginiamycin B lyase